MGIQALAIDSGAANAHILSRRDELAALIVERKAAVARALSIQEIGQTARALEEAALSYSFYSRMSAILEDFSEPAGLIAKILIDPLGQGGFAEEKAELIGILMGVGSATPTS